MLFKRLIVQFIITACLLKTAIGSHFPRRAIVTTPDLLGINGAILSKDGVATSCEIALIGSSAGFVSANCFEQKGSSSAKYEVLFYDAKNDSKPISYPLDMTDVRFHPGYDAATLEYNIAVIKFNKGASDDYTSYISGPYFEIEHSSYVLRSVDEETGKWRIPNNVEFQREDQDCPSWSGIYAKNDRVLLCTSLVQSPDDTETRCPNPYSAIYSMTNGKIGIVGLYSHSVIFGNSTCGESVKWLSYYTYLFRYAGFAVGILDRTIYSFDFGGEYSTTTSDTNMFIENKPADINMSGKTLIGGDIFGRKRSLEPSKSTEASQSTETSQSTGTTSSSPTLVSDIADSAQGLTRDAKIAIGVAVPLGSLLLIVISAFIWREWKKRQYRKNWDPHAQNVNINEIANQLVADTQGNTNPPPYFRVAVHEEEHEEEINHDTPAGTDLSETKK